MIPTFKKMPDGSLIVDPLTRYVKTGLLVPSPASVPLVIGANGQSPPISIESPQDSAGEILYLQGEHDAGVNADVSARMECVILDQAFRRDCMNRSILVNHVFGSAQTPFFLKESVFLQPQQILQFSFFNRSAAGATSFRFAATQRKIQNSVFAHPEMNEYIRQAWTRKTFLQPFWFTTDNPVTVPAGGTVNSFFTNTNDRFVVFWYLIGSAITTGVAGDTQEIFSFRFFDAKTDRLMMNQPVTLNTGCGTAGFPYMLPAPWLLEPSTQIRVEFRNLITDQPTQIFMTLCGVANYTGNGLWAYLKPGTPNLNQMPPIVPGLALRR